ncbi:hypothetical protein ACX0HA_16765 [Flavobacterium hauense]
MIKTAIDKVIVAAVFLMLLSCGEEKKEAQSQEELYGLKDSIASGVKPATVSAPIMSTHKDTIAKYSPVSNPAATGCQILRKGTFTYSDTQGDPVVVKIVDDMSTEEHKGGKYILMSKLTWKGECEYDNMLIMSTVPGVQLEPGTVMNVVVDKVDGNDIYFTATAKGKSYHNMLTKVK